MEQLAKQIADKSSNNFLANTEQNPKEECKVVMTRSKRFVQAEDEDNVVHKKKTTDKKGTDGKKNKVSCVIIVVCSVYCPCFPHCQILALNHLIFCSSDETK